MMSETKTRYDITSADTKLIGVDYQFFYFVKAVLSLERGEEVGYEVKDDVHITLSNGNLILIQLKHTTQKKSNGTPINLSELDNDLMKTLYNWIKVLQDPANERSSQSKQLDFLKNTKFILATNKCIKKNKLIDNILNLQNKLINFLDLKNHIQELLDNTQSEETKKYINTILELDDIIFENFFINTKFDSNSKDIIKDIKELISNKYIIKSRINDVFNNLFSELKTAYYTTVNNGDKFIVSYGDWYEKILSIFENSRRTTLPIRELPINLPDNLDEQFFIKELIEIGDLEINEIGQIEEFTTYMMEIELNLTKWFNDGDITLEDLNSFKEDAILIWKNTHKSSHRTTKTNCCLDKSNALNCLDTIRSRDLHFKETPLGVKHSNGEFYMLSNYEKIGWLKKWEMKYKQ